jgi:hypothetical protein
MSCRDLEKLLSAGAPESECAVHRAACPICVRLAVDANDVEESLRLMESLQAPAWSSSLREALFTIPQKTISCEGAAMAIAAALEKTDTSALAPADRSRLEFHLARCEGCREALETLAGASELTAPQPAPWVTPRLAASRPVRSRPRWKAILDPRAAIAFAYAAAVVVMLAGFNPADLARKAEANWKFETRSAAAAASGSLADRVGAFEDRAVRAFAIWRGRAGGYSRAVLANAIALVMRSEDESRPPGRPRNGEGRVPQKNENENTNPMWRA